MSPHVEDFLENESVESFVPSSSVNGINGGSNGTNGHITTTYTNGDSTPSPVTNGHAKPQHRERSQYLVPSDPDCEHDLICVGFGPASLSVAVAMHDAIAAGKQLRPDGSAPRVLFLEKQQAFSWHSGMLIPGAKMQISFIKDLATMRDPRSEFTFLNYLHRQGRLVDFTNLSTFLPARAEYEDYMRWAASFFEPLVRYNHEVLAVTPDAAAVKGGVQSFTVQARSVKTGQTQSFRGRHVLVATGGQPALPKSFPQKNPRVIHSSQYIKVLPQLLPTTSAPYRVAVVGGGQSAAEIFSNIQKTYPNSETRLIMRQEFLRPSDDSPFVNCVFNPEYIDSMFPRSARARNNLLAEAKATNYSVVRLELIEEIFERMYDQSRDLGADEKAWPHRVMGGRQIKSIEARGDGTIDLHIQGLEAVTPEGSVSEEEFFQADLVVAATGYQRSTHIDMLRGAWELLPKAGPTDGIEYRKGIAGWNVETEQGERKLSVGRDYQIKFAPGAVAEGAGIWLQGCCEGTHGLSDTLLSVLSTRSGEIVESIFGKQ